MGKYKIHNLLLVVGDELGKGDGVEGRLGWWVHGGGVVGLEVGVSGNMMGNGSLLLSGVFARIQIYKLRFDVDSNTYKCELI